MRAPIRRSRILATLLFAVSLGGCSGMLVEVGSAKRGGSLSDEVAVEIGQPTLAETGRASSFEENDIRVGLGRLDDDLLVEFGLSRWSTSVRADPSEHMSVYSFDVGFDAFDRFLGPLATSLGLGFEISRAKLSLVERDWSGLGLAFPVRAGGGLLLGPVLVRGYAEYRLIRLGGEYDFYEKGECLEGYITVGVSGGSACYRREIVADSGLTGELERLTYTLSVGLTLP